MPAVAERRLPVLASVVLAAALTYAYWDVAVSLVRQWSADGNYSHGFLILPAAAYFAWRRRARLAELPLQPRASGLVVVAGSLALLAAGVAASELFVARVSVIGVLAGSVLFLFGLHHLRVLAFPLAFLLLMIPLPEIVFNQLALPLQLVASQVGEVTLRAFGIPVLRDGNVLELVGMRLEVAEACSGIRSIVSLLTFAIVLAQLGGASASRAWILVVATIPIAVLANATRVAATGLAAQQFGPAVVEGELHSASGMLVFLVAVGALLLLDRGLVRSNVVHTGVA